MLPVAQNRQAVAQSFGIAEGIFDPRQELVARMEVAVEFVSRFHPVDFNLAVLFDNVREHDRVELVQGQLTLFQPPPETLVVGVEFFFKFVTDLPAMGFEELNQGIVDRCFSVEQSVVDVQNNLLIAHVASLFSVTLRVSIRRIKFPL